MFVILIIGNRYLYFHALASNTENRVPLQILDNSTAWEQNVQSFPREFVEVGQRQVQATQEAMDSQGNLFFGLENPNALACWNIERPYDRSNVHIVAQNDQTLQFASGVKVILNKKGKEELWALTCRFQVKLIKTFIFPTRKLMNLQIAESYDWNNKSTRDKFPHTSITNR